MIKLDIDKLNTHNCYFILREGFGKELPILVNYFSDVGVNADGIISSLDYASPKDGLDHWCYGHQIDEIVYTTPREKFVAYCACGEKLEDGENRIHLCLDCSKKEERLLKSGEYSKGHCAGYLLDKDNRLLHLLQIEKN